MLSEESVATLEKPSPKVPLKVTLEAVVRTLPADVHALQTIRLNSYAASQAWKRTLPRLSVGGEWWCAQEADASQPDLKVVDRLGEGGMGVVHLARQRSLQREVAIKSLRPELLSVERIEAMLHEARYTGLLEHPNIIPVHALGLDRHGHPLLVMKRVEGVPWRELIQDPEHDMWDGIDEEPLVWHLRVLSQVCNAVHFAHSRGVLHRDIKPDNVMVGEFGEVYLLDWGVALDMTEPASREVRMIGTPAYMAPELVTGQDAEMGRWTDVYLLGACLYEVLTGSPPHQGESFLGVVLEAAECRPPVFDSEVPEELAAICQRALAASPTARHPDAQSLRRALDVYLTHRDSIRLSDIARSRWSSARDAEAAGGDLVELQRLFSVSRFGFEQALEIWAGNPDAVEGLRDVLIWMAGVALSHAELQQADHLLGELRVREMPVPEALLRQREDVVSELARRAGAESRLAAMEYEHDLSHARMVRMRNGTILGVVLVIGFTILAVLRRQGIYSPGHHEHIALVTCMLTIFVSLVVIARRHVLGNARNRQIMFSLTVMCVGALCCAIFCALSGISLELAFGVNYLIAAIVSMIVAPLMERGHFTVAIPFVIATFVTAWKPDLFLEMGVFSVFVSHVLAILSWGWAAWEERRAAKGGAA